MGTLQQLIESIRDRGIGWAYKTRNIWVYTILGDVCCFKAGMREILLYVSVGTVRSAALFDVRS